MHFPGAMLYKTGFILKIVNTNHIKKFIQKNGCFVVGKTSCTFAAMTRWENYQGSAVKIITRYQGDLPLHHYLKQFFKQHPQMGSRDRKWISRLVYDYFRLGHWALDAALEERIQKAVCICEPGANDFLAAINPELNELAALPLERKLESLTINNSVYSAEQLFPFAQQLSAEIDIKTWASSLLKQPLLFIRVRPGKRTKVIDILGNQGVDFQYLDNEAIALPQGTNLEQLILDKDWYEIQDLSSQTTMQLLTPKPGEYWWDCCAASGGKSILLKDKEPGIKLFASDIRPSIIQNLQKRLTAAKVSGFQTGVIDLNQGDLASLLPRKQFDGILLDAPCSGSGTWGRTPENLVYFEAEKIDYYADLQWKIATNVLPYIKPGGSFVYITCSVFAKENEQMVTRLLDTGLLEKESGGLIDGSAKRADSMFAVRFRKK